MGIFVWIGSVLIFSFLYLSIKFNRYFNKNMRTRDFWIFKRWRVKNKLDELSTKLLIRKARTKIGRALSQPPPGAFPTSFSPREQTQRLHLSFFFSFFDHFNPPRFLSSHNLGQVLRWSQDFFILNIYDCKFRYRSNSQNGIPPLDRILDDDDTAYIHFLFVHSLENFTFVDIPCFWARVLLVE